jgi:hypothetical protein
MSQGFNRAMTDQALILTGRLIIDFINDATQIYQLTGSCTDGLESGHEK